MHPSSPPIINVGGRSFIEAKPEDSERLCTGCVADEHGNGHLCQKLPPCSGRTFSIIFKEIA
jgi:hypothetical protein